MKYCPNCRNPLDADTEVYTNRRKSVHEGVEIIGCDRCIRCVYADEVFDHEDLYDLERQIDQAMWEYRKDRRIERMMGEE